VSVRALEARNGDVRLAYEVRGSGDPLLMIHGLGYDRFGWGPLPDLLAHDFAVVLLDNRGVGASDAPEGPYSVQQLAEDAIAVLDAEGIERTHLFGVSLGGYIAQELALTQAHRLNKLVLASTAPGGPSSHAMPQRGLEAFGRFPTLEREAGLRLMVENSLGDRAVRDRPELVEEVFAYRLSNAPTLAGWQAQAYAGATFDAFDRIPDIDLPTLILQGTGDNVVDPRNADLLGERIPGARVEFFPDRGHLLVWEEGAAIAETVKEFLQS
jgi:pimeloyl-ACP methyl ester carboxylesterase